MKTLLFHNYRPARLVYQHGGETVKLPDVKSVSETWEGIQQKDLTDKNKRLELYFRADKTVKDLMAEGKQDKTDLASKLSKSVEDARKNESEEFDPPANVARGLFKNLLRISGMIEKDPALTAQDYASKAKLDAIAKNGLPTGNGATESGSKPTEKVALTQADSIKIALNNEGKQMKEAITSSGTLTKEVVSAPSSAPAIPKKV